MKLSVGERLMLLQILPPMGSIVTLKICKDLSDIIALSEEELDKFKVQHEGDKVTWDTEKDKGTELKIGERATDIIVESLKNLDNEKRLIPQMMSLWEKFIETKEGEKI